jgi:hypothetical protein
MGEGHTAVRLTPSPMRSAHAHAHGGAGVRAVTTPVPAPRVVEEVGVAFASDLYDLGPYPALVAGGSVTVAGGLRTSLTAIDIHEEVPRLFQER